MQSFRNCKSRNTKYDFPQYSWCLDKKLSRFVIIYAYIRLFLSLKFKNANYNDNYKTFDCPKQDEWPICLNIESKWFFDFKKSAQNI
jgi:hypothetical protein